MPHERGHAHEVPVGATVLTRDGEHLGQVKEARPDAFKVDVRLAPDYWLSTGDVESVEEEHVRMNFTKDQLDDARVPNPDEDLREAEEARERVGVDAPVIGGGLASAVMVGMATSGAPEADIELPGGTDPIGEATGRPFDERDERGRAQTVGSALSGMDAPGSDPQAASANTGVSAEEGAEAFRTAAGPGPGEDSGDGTPRSNMDLTGGGRLQVGQATGRGMASYLAWDEAAPAYKGEWERRGGERSGPDRRWEAIEPAYRYSHEMRVEERYQGRSFTEAESELRSGYGDWSRERGYAEDENAWDRLKDDVRTGWERPTGEDERGRR